MFGGFRSLFNNQRTKWYGKEGGDGSTVNVNHKVAWRCPCSTLLAKRCPGFDYRGHCCTFAINYSTLFGTSEGLPGRVCLKDEGRRITFTGSHFRGVVRVGDVNYTVHAPLSSLELFCDLFNQRKEQTQFRRGLSRRLGRDDYNYVKARVYHYMRNGLTAMTMQNLLRTDLARLYGDEALKLHEVRCLIDTLNDVYAPQFATLADKINFQRQRPLLFPGEWQFILQTHEDVPFEFSSDVECAELLKSLFGHADEARRQRVVAFLSDASVSQQARFEEPRFVRPGAPPGRDPGGRVSSL